ncbi:MAG: hypothetical protein QXQ18_02465, partial [Candidatus Aenigmatarchaeota archaeon]
EKIYFGLEKITDKREIINSKRLFEFVYFLKPPKKPSIHVNYSTWLEIAKVLPEKNQIEFAVKKLIEYGYLKKPNQKIKKIVERNLNFAKKWIEDFIKTGLIEKVSLEEKMKIAIKELIEAINKSTQGEELQKEIFEIARKHNINPPIFFKTIYQILIKSKEGPRLGPYIFEMGKEEAINRLKEAIK